MASATDAIFNSIDTNGDGVISREEFNEHVKVAAAQGALVSTPVNVVSVPATFTTFASPPPVVTTVTKVATPVEAPPPVLTTVTIPPAGGAVAATFGLASPTHVSSPPALVSTGAPSPTAGTSSSITFAGLGSPTGSATIAATTLETVAPAPQVHCSPLVLNPPRLVETIVRDPLPLTPNTAKRLIAIPAAGASETFATGSVCLSVPPAAAVGTDAFDMLDTNHDGVISREEFEKGVSVMPNPPNLSFVSAPLQAGSTVPQPTMSYVAVPAPVTATTEAVDLATVPAVTTSTAKTVVVKKKKGCCGC